MLEVKSTPKTKMTKRQEAKTLPKTKLTKIQKIRGQIQKEMVQEKIYVKKYGGAWQCQVCQKIFSSRYKAVNHLEEHNLSF